MKRIALNLLLLFSLPFLSLGQDLLVTTKNDSLNCKIIAVTPEEITFEVIRNGARVQTHITADSAADIQFGYYEKGALANRLKADEETFYTVMTHDGNVYAGQIIERSSTAIKLKTKELGTIELPLTSIKKVASFNDESEASRNAHWFDYLESSRYFYGPSALGLKQGDAYYQNTWILFNHFSLGITDHVSVGLGIVPLFLFAGAPTPIWLTPKVSVPVVKDKFSLGGGALIGGVMGLEDSGFGVVYGAATLGDRDRNLTAGVGFGYVESDFNSRPTLSLSGMTKVGKKVYLITENYLFEDGSLLSFGGRSTMRAASLDYGLVMPVAPNQDFFVAIPWLGLVIPIQTKLKG